MGSDPNGGSSLVKAASLSPALPGGAEGQSPDSLAVRSPHPLLSTVDEYMYFEYCLNMETAEFERRSTEAIAAAFAALGQPSRLTIVRLLLSAHPRGLPAGEIQKELKVSAPTLSHHLEKLRQVGIVSAQKDRQWIWYSVRSESLRSLIDFLFEECCTRNQVVAMTDLEISTVSAAHTETDCCE
ncbi:MAG: ArsR/SmtB family transcription factor [Leptolyngbyaceae cyanobacterium]